jgi:hypothetical protein
MLAVAVVPVLVGILGALVSRRVAVSLAPPLAASLLTGLALSVSLACGVILALAGLVALAEVPPTSLLGGWSPDTLRDHIPMPPLVGAVAAAVALVLIACAVAYAIRVAVQTRRTGAAALRLRTTVDGLVIVHDREPVAYALPGRRQRIVVSTGMLKLLPAAQRRALLAHEAAHLRYHHQTYVQLGRLAASANPLMWPVSRAIDLAVERWADEVAAREVGDRATVAHALAAAALAPRPAPRGALSGAQSNVTDRVQVLLTPQPPRRLLIAALTATGAVGCWIAALLLTDRVSALLELAQRVAAH